MKLAKTIIIAVLAVLLAISVALNMILLCKELLSSLDGYRIGASKDISEVDTAATRNTGTVNPGTSEPSPCGSIIYEDTWIRVKEVKQDIGTRGPIIVVEIENIASETVGVSFRNLSIDGYVTQYSYTGVYREILDPGIKAIRNILLWESDYESFTTKPEQITFDIDLINPASFGTISSKAVTLLLK